MKKPALSLLVLVCFIVPGGESAFPNSKKDWLIDPNDYLAQITTIPNGQFIQLSNGLVSRTLQLQPNAATISLRNLITGEEFLRSVRPEAEIVIDKVLCKIGGLVGQPIHNYLSTEWLSRMRNDSLAFQFVSYQTGAIRERFPYRKRLEWMPDDLPWPPRGKSLDLRFRPPQDWIPQMAREYPELPKSVLTRLKKLVVIIHYQIYDGIPLICKWVTVENHSSREIRVNTLKSEILAVVEGESSVGEKRQWRLPSLTVETDYAFGGGMSAESCIGKSVFWQPDPLYSTQVNYQRQTPCLLVCRPQYGPAKSVAPGARFESFRAFELLHDSDDRERRGLAQRQMYRILAPWVTENPILMHMRRADDRAVKLAIDQCAEVGFEMVILTFGSGFTLEDESDENLNRMKQLADYAHSKGIALGGYSLLASRKVGGGNDVVMPEGTLPTFGNSPCLGSKWGREYFRKLVQFFQKTGFDVLEHNGSYPGDVCAATNHPGHEGLADSQWNQFIKIRDFYRWCRGRGIYLNVPDWYFLNGSNKTGMGYRETNWSLPRNLQEIIERQNIYDGTWEKTPSMGWMFVPLTQYHKGGAAATIEPLKQHLAHYRRRLMNLFGAGVQACFRGPRLYDAPETKKLVRQWVTWYKTYRPILDSDIIHVRRPDGRNLDCILHVNPRLKRKGLAVVYNPTNHPLADTLELPLYYTGLTRVARIREQGGEVKNYPLDRSYHVQLPVRVPAHEMNWFVIQ